MNEQNKKMKQCNICGKDIAKNAKVCMHCGGKVKQPFYKKTWFIVLVVVVVIAVIAGGAGSSDTPASGNNADLSVNSGTVDNNEQVNTSGTEIKEIEYAVYDVNELMDDLNNNALKAENKYHNQYVEITGVLRVIDSDGAYISLYPSNNEFSLVGVTCYVKNAEQKAKVIELSKNDIVTLRGKIRSVGEVLGYSLDIDSIA